MERFFLFIYEGLLFKFQGVSKWIQAWKKNGWKSAAGSNVKNQVDIKRLDDLCQKVRVNWVGDIDHKFEIHAKLISLNMRD